MRGQKRGEDARKRAYDPRINQKNASLKGWIAGSSPAMTGDGSVPTPFAILRYLVRRE